MVFVKSESANNSGSNSNYAALNFSGSADPTLLSFYTSHEKLAITFYTVDDASFEGYNVTGETVITHNGVLVSQQTQSNNVLNGNTSVEGDYTFYGTLSLAPSATNFRNLKTYFTNGTDKTGIKPFVVF